MEHGHLADVNVPRFTVASLKQPYALMLGNR